MTVAYRWRSAFRATASPTKVGRRQAERHVNLDEVIAAVRAALDARPGAVAESAAVAGAYLYKVKGKMFAILATRGVAAVSLKCDPHLAEVLREQYAGVGHRYHLDRRHWISVTLDADVPVAEILRLIDQSYDLVRANLSRAQRAELDAVELKNSSP